jgi:hypothetical protein
VSFVSWGWFFLGLKGRIAITTSRGPFLESPYFASFLKGSYFAPAAADDAKPG